MSADPSPSELRAAARVAGCREEPAAGAGLGPSELRAAARVACEARGLDRRPIRDYLPFLAEDVGRLVNAVRRDDLAAVRGELADCAAILDHIAELYDGRELAALIGEKVAAEAHGGPARASSVW